MKKVDSEYYLTHRASLLHDFDEEVQHWRLVIASQYGSDFADQVLQDSHEVYAALIPHIPYIGGEGNPLTQSLIDAVRCFAFYQAMKMQGHTAAQTGKILYDAILARCHEPSPPVLPTLTPEQQMERRKQRAESSQERRYAVDYVYTFVTGDGGAFDYGYDFSECAAQKFYQAHAAEEFLPYYCYLDFAWSHVLGLGLSRSMTLSEGDAGCNHRFKRGRETAIVWPPPFEIGGRKMLDLQELLRQWISGALSPPPIAALIGFNLVSAEGGRSRLHLPAGRNHHNPMGQVHGGIFCDLADAAMGTALASLMQPGEFFSTTSLSIQYFMPVQEGMLIAEGRVLRRGKTIAHIECDITDDQGNHVAKAWSTCQVREV